MNPHYLSVTADDGQPRGALALGVSGNRGPKSVPSHAIVGEFVMTGGGPDWATFKRNAQFVAFYTRYMRGELTVRPAILAKARVAPGENVYVIDARTEEPEGKVPWTDIIGWYRSAPGGAPLAETFVYNDEHALVAEGKLSSLLFEDELQRALLHFVV